MFHHPMAHLVAVHAVNNHRPVQFSPPANPRPAPDFSTAPGMSRGSAAKAAPPHVEKVMSAPSDQGVQGSASQGFFPWLPSVPSRHPMMQLLQTSTIMIQTYHETLGGLPQQLWLLLIYQLPPQPAYFRVKIWRRLQAMGAVAIKGAVYALPIDEQTQEDFRWLVQEIIAGGGEAALCEARFIDGLSDQQARAVRCRATRTMM